MADRDYIDSIVEKLSYLPNCPIKAEKDIVPVSEMFFVILKDLSPALLDKAVLYYLGQSTPFFPMPGTLRQKALELQMAALEIPTGTEAWGMVLNRGYRAAIACGEAEQIRAELSTLVGGAYLAKIKALNMHEQSCGICSPVSFEPVYAHPLVAKTVHMLGGLDAILTDNPTADRARFVDAYNEILERERSKIGMVPEVREYVNALTDERRAALDTGEEAEIQQQFRLLAEGMKK